MDIPGYTVEKEVGHGGMATVYLAMQESLQRQVVLKVMAPALAADRTFGERFLREGRMVAQLNHPNILSIYDIGEEGHHFYLAAEYLPGGDLKDLVKQGMSPDDALRVLKDIGAALSHAHEKDFVHRDIKPENILFREDGTAVLTDFGIQWRWFPDWYGKNYYASSIRQNPLGSFRGTQRVFRGGAWKSWADRVRVTDRRWRRSSIRYASLGFRLVLPRK